jgi:hypothetical protein
LLHIATVMLDVLIVVVALVLARILRLWFFYVALICAAALGLVRLHYGLNYQWTFVGKYAVNVVIPVVMAWAGNYLAAKSSTTETEARLWQALFMALTLLALGGSFWVLSNEERDHTTEMKGLRGDIKDDMTKALVDYNNAHPSNPVTSEQFSELTRSLNQKQNPTIAAPVVEATSSLARPAPRQAPPLGTLNTQAPPLRPVILSAPKIFTDGQIKGKNFGTSPSELYLHVRVKPSAQRGDYGSEGRVGPNNLLGNVRGVNEPLIEPGIIQKWSDTAITLKFPSGYWQDLLNRIITKAQERNVAPPQQSDLEVGYHVVVGGDFRSGIVYAQ